MKNLAKKYNWALIFISIVIHPVYADNSVKAFIDSVTDNLIIPALEKSLLAAEALNHASQEFCAQPDTEKLAQLQQNWKSAMHNWSANGLFRFGPMLEDNIDLKIHYLPVRKKQIEANIKADMITAGQVSVSARGLASLEYLIFDRKLSPAEITGIFTNQPDRCRYVTLLTDFLVKDNRTILDGWQNQFAEQFKGGNEIITTPEALSEIIGSAVVFFESSIKNRLGRPAGINQKQPSPYKAESWRSGESLNNLLAGLNTFELMLTQSNGLIALLSDHNHSELAKQLLDQTEQLQDSLAKIEPDLFNAVQNDPQKVQAAYDQFKRLTDLLKIQTAKVLDVQIGFSDQDGD